MKEDTKEKIISTAYKLFAKKGFESCSMNDIAHEANVNKASIYYYFPSKEKVYEAVITGILETFYARISTAVEKEEEPQAKLYAFIYAFGENFKNNQQMAPLMLRELASGGVNLSADTKAILSKNMALLHHILELGKMQGIFKEYPVFIIYLMIVGTMNIYTSASKLRKDMSQTTPLSGLDFNAKEISNTILNLLMDGLHTKDTL